MKYLVGMDGGGTKTACVVTDTKGNTLYECSGGPSNFLIIGTGKVAETLFNLISESKEKLKAEYSDFISIVLGTTGAGRRPDAEKMEQAFCEYAKEKGVTFNSFYVDSDARIALEGAFSGKPGSILIAGTGSIMFGKDAKGVIHRVGGFGRFIGDQGSGYVIGRRGLTVAGKDFDGRGEKTILTSLIAENFGMSTPEIMISEVYKNNFDIARVAPLVIKAAEMGDEACQNIVEEECYELVLHVHAMLKKMQQEELNLCLIGGIASSDNFMSKRFCSQVEKKFPKVNIKEPDFPPAMGAVIMAKEKAGI